MPYTNALPEGASKGNVNNIYIYTREITTNFAANLRDFFKLPGLFQLPGLFKIFEKGCPYKNDGRMHRVAPMVNFYFAT